MKRSLYNKIKILIIVILSFSIINVYSASTSAPPEGADAPSGTSGQSSAQGSGGGVSDEELRSLQTNQPRGIYNKAEYNRIMKMLLYGSDFQKSQAALTFGKAGEKRAVPNLIHQLRDNSVKVMGSIADALGMIKDKRAVRALTQWLRKYKRAILIKSYGRMNFFFVKAVWALGEIKDKRATDELIFCIRAKYRPLRVEALRALVKINDKKALPALQKAYIKETNYHVKKLIKHVITKLGGRVHNLR